MSVEGVDGACEGRGIEGSGEHLFAGVDEEGIAVVLISAGGTGCIAVEEGLDGDGSGCFVVVVFMLMFFMGVTTCGVDAVDTVDDLSA